ncbi:MAG: polysaccharide deacetylase family protein [Candidatus Marinimicrobia bacterium]|jgi:peptidoglycan/xylan/chitin deacetylase (PgdA/CDA1 family)|nr:polysaccharide deacetylase family protein [Candidatus Neomarinimicrobiota bacterium]MBT3631811.1 polysaccharide deacetylase family protein [Candidatus Neomarinimicrobiota bacterium]MBT3825030.1 polysaccharide deacetylase family protein [Candidatus Neomarinimicrobiota bacterium]MBT4296417.1 polysaccharide deacetylase family protein [Candidatus Neomarinimicrobiota bacterium]MBT4418603.1 polysaccharide deacetylase family protein [Candidatus Neomarinimicrobiota bacterium]
MSFPVYNRGLVYHKVSEDYEWGVTTTTPQQFRAQMLVLQHLGFSFSRIMDYDPTLNQILITFDDGYSCINEFAVPILEEVGGVATVFAITDFVGKKNSWDYFPESKQVGHMNWSELRSLHERGWEIGSHGKSHRRMIAMDSNKIEDELLNSKKRIEDQLGSEVRTFCPPFNAWNSDLLLQIEDAGYTKVAISYPLTGLPKWGGSFVPRLGVYLHDTKPLFLGKIFANPLAPLQVLQQQLINIAGDGKILESWLKPLTPE